MKTDIVLVCDATHGADMAFRLAQEVSLFHRYGLSVVVRHIAMKKDRTILPDVAHFLRRKHVMLSDTETDVHAKLMIVHVADKVTRSLPELSSVKTDKVLLVHHALPDHSQIPFWNMFAKGPVIWAPTNRWVRQELVALDMPIPIEAEDWRPVASMTKQRPTVPGVYRPTCIGHLSSGQKEHWPKDNRRVKKTHHLPDDTYGIFIGEETDEEIRQTLLSSGWHEFKETDCSVERFLTMIDALIYLPDKPPNHLPDATISAAMASGKMVILPEFLRGHYGDSAFYPQDSEIPLLIASLRSDTTNGNSCKTNSVERLQRAKHEVTHYFPEEPQVARLSRLISKDNQPLRKTTQTTLCATSTQQVVFLTSSDIGLGHLARTLALARRIDKKFEPIFLTTTPNMELINSFGYHAEYIPSQASTPMSMDIWDKWFRIDVQNKLQRYNPNLFVYDGNTPTNGMIAAILSIREMSRCWIRRGMYADGATSKYINNSKFFDLIIEPGEIAKSLDNGITSFRQREAYHVSPILLLDQDELLTRSIARQKLGLDSNKSAALINLGIGANRNLPELVEYVVRQLKNHDDIQIVIVEAKGTPHPFPPWENVKFVSGMPISLYFNAFDFQIASSGYNTFHEVMTYGLPTIFIPNDASGMDDQAARADYAQEHGAGFKISEDEISLLPIAINTLLSDKIRGNLSKNCIALMQKNGAQEAADALSHLVSNS